MKKITTLSCALLIAGAAFAQIPNAGFETWTTSGTYEDPTSWQNPNLTTNAYSTTIYTCEHGTAGAPEGTSFLKLTSKSISGVVATGVATTGSLGIAVTPPAYGTFGGYPFTSRPLTLTGKWQHSGTATDNGRVTICLTKWNIPLNRRDTVAFKDTLLTGSVTSWTNFSIPLTYVSTASPDTALIVFASSWHPTSAVAGSYLYVDDLKFPITITGTSSVCIGATTTLASSGSVGSWSSGTTSIAIVDAAGTVTGIAAGIAVISYTEGTTIGTQLVTVNSCPAGIPATANNQTLNIYPNPSPGTFVIDIPAGEKNAVVTVTDVLGKVVFTATYTGAGALQCNLSNVPQGSYIVKVAAGERVYRSKITVTN